MNKALSTTLLIFLHVTDIQASDFFNQRYRGWVWFEENQKVEERKDKTQQEHLKKQHDHAKAKEEVKQFARELEDLRYMMIRYPDSIEHARAYKLKKAQMLDDALKLADTFRMVNFLYPEQVNLIDNPTNLYGRRVKEEVDQKGNNQKIVELATQVELFVFFSSNCPYCQSLEPVLSDFARRYGFTVEAVSLDGSSSKHFKTHQDQGLATKLGLQRTPTIMAVTNDSNLRFELIRGAASASDLEEVSLLAFEYLNNFKKLDKHEL